MATTTISPAADPRFRPLTATWSRAWSTVAGSDIERVRRRLRACVLSGQRRLHFVNERNQCRQQLLAEFGRRPTRGQVVAVRLGARGGGHARKVALEQILTELHTDVDHPFIESRHGRDSDDRRVFAASLKLLDRSRSLRYEHRQPFEEPGLWLPDGFAWAAGAGRDRRSLPARRHITIAGAGRECSFTAQGGVGWRGRVAR